MCALAQQSSEPGTTPEFAIQVQLEYSSCVTSPPYAAAWVRRTNLTFSDILGPVRLAL
jgi:hypothetical protein